MNKVIRLDTLRDEKNGTLTPDVILKKAGEVTDIKAMLYIGITEDNDICYGWSYFDRLTLLGAIEMLKENIIASARDDV